MKRIVYFATFAALAASGAVLAVGSIAAVTIIDRTTGVALSPRYFRGEYWVAGTPGATYAIEIRNQLGERLLAVTSVDGVNVVSGATAGWDQAGYVFGPGERYQISGWRKTDAEVAAFTFTDSSNSYAERTGRPANVGVIGVAVFRERQLQAVIAPPPPEIGQSPEQEPLASRLDRSKAPLPRAANGKAASREAASGPMAAPSPASAQPGAPTPAATPSADSALSSEIAARAAPTTTPKLGTGHGEREYSYVTHTEFVRMQSQPNEVIRIHYDSLDNLIAMGVVKRPRPPVRPADPFPISPDREYVPDPPG
jgi:hypothetical protein